VSATDRYLPDEWQLPALTEFNRAFFTSGTLKLQQCVECKIIQHPPGEFCFACGGFEFDYIDGEARGTISGYTIVRHPVHPLLTSAIPYNVVVVQLDEYPHVEITGNVVDCSPDDLKIGAAVNGEWTDPLDDGANEPVRLLQWRLSS
jgi:uncharacterized OB-fold protein